MKTARLPSGESDSARPPNPPRPPPPARRVRRRRWQSPRRAEAHDVPAVSHFQRCPLALKVTELSVARESMSVNGSVPASYFVFATAVSATASFA